MMWGVAIALSLLVGHVVARPLRAHSPLQSLAATIIVAGMGLGVYALMGAPSQPGQPAAAEDAMLAELADGAELLRKRLYEEDTDFPADAYAALAIAYEQLNRPRAASIAWHDAVKRAPDQLSHYEGLLRALLVVHQGFITEPTKQVIDEVLRRDPAHQAARLGMARWYDQEGQPDMALAAFYSIVDELPKDNPVRFGIISQIWKIAAANNIAIPARFLPPPAMRDRLAAEGIDIPLPQAQSND